jgi:protein-tyrosine kinase
MGKIETALNLAKQAKAKQSEGKQERRRSTEYTAALAPVPDAWDGITKVALDRGRMAKNRITLGLPERNSAEMAYNMLRTRLIRRMRNNSWSSFIVTSPNVGAGKSVTAINLAISLSREHNQTVYLIDLDLREPKLNKYLGVDNPPGGITTYLNSTCGLSEAMVDGGVPRLYFALNTVAHQHSAELLTSPRMRQFVEELKLHDPNGIVIYDAPPMLVTDDALAFLPLVDAVLLVAAQGETKRDELVKTISLLEESHLLGVVLNKSVDIERENVYY